MKNEKGQGLIETIIAISVVVTGLIGAISLVNFTIRSTNTSENRLIALNLSWEAVEAAINIRDTNYILGVSFDTLLNGGTDTTAVFDFDETINLWFVDFTPNDFTDANTVLYRKGGVYRHAIGRSDQGQSTIFKRLVTLDTSVPEVITVTSVVQWSERGNIKEVSSVRDLYDWR